MNKLMIFAFFIPAFLISGCSTSGNQNLKMKHRKVCNQKSLKTKQRNLKLLPA